MRRRLARIVPKCLVLVLVSNVWIWAPKLRAQPEVDILPQYIVSPAPGGRTPINIPVPVSVMFLNAGSTPQYKVVTSVVIRDTRGVILFDSVRIIDTFPEQYPIEVSYGEWTPVLNGAFYLTAACNVKNDEVPENDTLKVKNGVWYETDTRVITVLSPNAADPALHRVKFDLVGSFHSVGSHDLYEIPARVQIRRCTDGALVFRADTIIPALLFDSLPVTFRFPPRQGSYDVRTLSPGCYTVAMIVRHPSDGDRTNDTAYSKFTISPHTLPDDVQADTILSPAYDTAAVGEAVPIQVRFSNTGANYQPSSRVRVRIGDNNGKLVYQDSALINAFEPRTSRTVTFRSFTPNLWRTYSITASIDLPQDSFELNDAVAKKLVVGPPCDVILERIVKPVPGEIKPARSPMPITIRGRWDGSRDSRDVGFALEFRRCADTALVTKLSGYARLPHTGTASDVLLNILPSDTSRIRSMLPGCYDLTLYSRENEDIDRSNDTVRTTFEFRHTHDLVVRSILSPTERSNHEQRPVAIQAMIENAGTDRQPLTYVSATVRDSTGSIVYVDSVHQFEWPGATARTIDFEPFVPPVHGYYAVYVTAVIAADEYEQDNELKSRFYFGTDPGEFSIVKVLDPPDGARLKEGEAFKPRVIVVRSGGYGLNPVSLTMRLTKFDDEYFGQSLSDTTAFLRPGVLDTVRFSEYGVDSLVYPVGRYAVFVYPHGPIDDNPVNDTLTTYFEVGGQADVTEFLDDDSRVVVSPNPADEVLAISYEPGGAASTEIQLSSLTGMILHSESVRNSSTKEHQAIWVRHLPSGSYTLTLTHMSSNRSSWTEQYRVQIVR